MKILYIHQHFSTPQGSGSIRSYQFAKMLISRGHQVALVCGSNQKAVVGLSAPYNRGVRRGFVDGIDIIEIHVPYSNHDGFLRRVWKFCLFSFGASRRALSEDYDLVFASSTPLTVALPGILAKLFRRKLFLFEVRDLWPELPAAMGIIKNRFVLCCLSYFEKLTYKTADHCIGLSPGMCEGIKKAGISPDCITLIPNGCDLNIMSQAALTPELEVRWSNNFSQDDFVAIFAGAHGVANGLDAILDVAEILLDRQEYNIKFLFVGEGKLKRELRDRAAGKNLVNCIFWDPVPKCAMFGLLSRASIGLMLLRNIPAFYEGTSPNKFFDYIASGLPVVNNYPGWVAELIKQNECGVVVQPDDPLAFSEALLALRAMPKDELVQMGCNARKLALREFDRSALSEEFSILCEKIYGSGI
ncbi:MAG: glycosyltransferase WbuB [Gammaproteobacteria bacterium CG11_big_fil_rev_8_21_14_0_20_46_22]|nr:MAG: glycosyltransferase WbuB [Gammaproteobacteria bacterium CG12_big_fil_rev_8_21_14_0_65_46_12]PIR12131.1 MAG: glycosyltransferase WbuB [Gammaproteobacteria bacterium CG11_big_fil_rev_8_21_14_0_20_46_22]